MAGLATASGSFFLSLCVCVGGGAIFLHLSQLKITPFVSNFFPSSLSLPLFFLTICYLCIFERFIFTSLGFPPSLFTAHHAFVFRLLSPLFSFVFVVGHLQKRQRKHEHPRWVGVFTVAFSSSKGAGHHWLCVFGRGRLFIFASQHTHDDHPVIN